MKRTRRHQRRLGKPRVALPSSVEDRIWEQVDVLAAKFNCSRSFVVATLLYDQLGIKVDAVDRYDTPLKIVKRA
jgi:hypothetical protein